MVPATLVTGVISISPLLLGLDWRNDVIPNCKGLRLRVLKVDLADKKDCDILYDFTIFDANPPTVCLGSQPQIRALQDC